LLLWVDIHAFKMLVEVKREENMQAIVYIRTEPGKALKLLENILRHP